MIGNVPRVSVLMTVYNSDRHLQQSLDSLQKQEFKDFELIVLEHGSTDSSLRILTEWRDFRLSLEVLPRNIGRTSALNRCLSRAKGDYVAILDADDLAGPMRLLEQVELLDKNPNIGLVGTWAKYIDENNVEIKKHQPPTTHNAIVKAFANSNPFTHSSICFRRELTLVIGQYDDNYVYAQDFKFCVDLLQVTESAILPSFHCSWRDSTSSLTNSKELSVDRIFEEALIFEAMSRKLHFDRFDIMRNHLHRFLTRILLFRELLLHGMTLLGILTLLSLQRGRNLYIKTKREL